MIHAELNPDSFTLSHAEMSDDAFRQGRRSFLLARDLKIGEATGGKFGINHNRLTGAITSTGWHYHPVGLQIIYVLKGWIDLAFEDGRVIRIEEGGCMNIPPGMIHNEVATSDGMDVLEISMPAKITTVNVPAPAGMPESYATV